MDKFIDEKIIIVHNYYFQVTDPMWLAFTFPYRIVSSNTMISFPKTNIETYI